MFLTDVRIYVFCLVTAHEGTSCPLHDVQITGKCAGKCSLKDTSGTTDECGNSFVYNGPSHDETVILDGFPCLKLVEIVKCSLYTVFLP